MPLYQRVPKRSFNSKFATPMETVNLDKLQLFVDIGLRVCLQGRGGGRWQYCVSVPQPTGTACAAQAQKFEMPPQPARPNPKKLTYYTNYSHLSPEIQVKKALANASKSK
ncbi:hypothetical protein PI126_g10830 [Phytophthora idaei]|nr:hypothetical protein PI126_g10830 [Phytophthora idaei]